MLTGERERPPPPTRPSNCRSSLPGCGGVAGARRTKGKGESGRGGGGGGEERGAAGARGAWVGVAGRKKKKKGGGLLSGPVPNGTGCCVPCRLNHSGQTALPNSRGCFFTEQNGGGGRGRAGEGTRGGRGGKKKGMEENGCASPHPRTRPAPSQGRHHAPIRAFLLCARPSPGPRRCSGEGLGKEKT